MSRFTDQVALVTGASSGIGRATAHLLAEQGATVVLVALPGDDLERAASSCREVSPHSVAFGADVGDSAQVVAAFDAAQQLGDLTAVFNNAGTSIVSAITTMTDEEWERQLRTNLTGSFFVAREAARRMISAGRGAIVNTGSELAMLGQGGYVGYSATKGGVLALTRALAAEVAVHNVRVNSVSPGAINTPLLMAEFAESDDPAAELSENEQSIVIGRIGEPREIASAVAFLLSDEASYMTGANMMVDGGRSNCFPVGSIAKQGPSAAAGQAGDS